MLRNLAILLLLAASARPGPLPDRRGSEFNGRWDIAVHHAPPGRAWWLEVQGTGTPQIKGKFVGFPGGDLNDIQRIWVENGELRFTYYGHDVHQEYRARLVGSKLEGTFTSGDTKLEWTGARAGPFEFGVSRCERALQLAAHQSGAVFLMHVVAVVSKPQLAVLDPDTLDVVQIAAGEADELTFDMGRAGALDFQPPGPPARRMVYSDVPPAVEARVRGPGRRGQQQENSQVAEHDCLRINLSYARFQPAVRHIRE